MVFRHDCHSWYTVRAIWDVTGADMFKFETVAKTHMNQYISMIENSNENGCFKLPNSAQIEDSYVRALEKSGLSAKTAIDVVISKLDVENKLSPPKWHNSYSIMWLDKERVVPSYPSVLSKISTQNAENIYKKVAVSVVEQEAQEAYLRSDRKLPQVSKDDSWGITPIQGVYFYRNSRTENWAIYDKNGEGILYLDGHKEQINHTNFRLRPDVQHEFLKDGRWQIVQLEQQPLDMHQNFANPTKTQTARVDPESEGVGAPPMSAGRMRLDKLLAASQSGDEDIFRAARQELYDSPIGQSIRQQAIDVVNAQEQEALHQQQILIAQQQEEQMVRRGPVMRM